MFSDSYKVSAMVTSSDHFTMLILGFKSEDNKMYAVFSNKLESPQDAKAKLTMDLQ
jgi:hypothetical protein